MIYPLQHLNHLAPPRPTEIRPYIYRIEVSGPDGESKPGVHPIDPECHGCRWLTETNAQLDRICEKMERYAALDGFPEVTDVHRRIDRVSPDLYRLSVSMVGRKL